MTRVAVPPGPPGSPPRVLHVVESWRPVPSGYAARSWWIVTGQARANTSAPAVLVTSRQSVYGAGPAEAPADVPLDTLSPSTSEAWLRGRLPSPLARPWHVGARALEGAIVDAARRHDAELVHVHWSSAIGAAAAGAARRLRVPLVAEVRFDLAGAMGAQTFGGRLAPLENLLRRRFERHLDAATRIVAASDALAGLLRARFPALAPRLHVVPNGVDADFLARCDAVRAGRARGDGAPVTLGTTSKMLRYENLDALVELCAARPALDLVFVGDGPERGRLERRAAPLNAERAGRVRFTGRRPAEEMPERLADIDLFVVPRSDLAITRFASPIKVVEAMAAARAIVGTAVGDTRVLLDGGCGELVPAGDPQALGTAVDALAADPGRRAALGERARTRVAIDYDGTTLLARYADVYAAALTGGPPPRHRRTQSLRTGDATRPSIRASSSRGADV